MTQYFLRIDGMYNRYISSSYQFFFFFFLPINRFILLSTENRLSVCFCVCCLLLPDDGELNLASIR